MSHAKRYRVHESIFTTDTARWPRNTDTWLNAEVLPQNPNMFGHMHWTGNLRPVGNAVGNLITALSSIKDKATRDAAYARAVCAIADADYVQSNAHASGTMGAGPAGALTTAPIRPEIKEFDLVADGGPVEMMAEAASNLWEGKSATSDRRSLARDVARVSSIAGLNAINAKFWSARETPPPLNKWGKG
jgi:hypothetical protein